MESPACFRWSAIVDGWHVCDSVAAAEWTAHDAGAALSSQPNNQLLSNDRLH